jgi:tetratricopeptide (TPR) repeat protein
MDQSQECDVKSRSTASREAAHIRRARALEQRGQYDEAIESLQKAIALAPQNPKHVIRLANLYKAQHKLEPAIEAMKKAIEIDPRNPGARESLLQIYLESGRYDEAITESKVLLKRHPRNLYARDILGVVYLQTGHIDKALQVTNELIHLDPMDPSNHFKKAVLYQQKGEIGKAVQEFSRVLEMDPDGEMAEEAREAVTALDSYQLRQVVTLAVEDPIFRAKLGRDPESAVLEKGFLLSYSGVMALKQIDLGKLPLIEQGLQNRYYS